MVKKMSNINAFHCKFCNTPIDKVDLNKYYAAYCPACDKELSSFDLIPDRCIDPVIKYCQGCEYGYVNYPSYVETYRDLDGCCFESGCIYGLENTQPSKEEIEEFDARKEQVTVSISKVYSGYGYVERKGDTNNES